MGCSVLLFRTIFWWTRKARIDHQKISLKSWFWAEAESGNRMSTWSWARDEQWARNNAWAWFLCWEACNAADHMHARHKQCSWVQHWYDSQCHDCTKSSQGLSVVQSTRVAGNILSVFEMRLHWPLHPRHAGALHSTWAWAALIWVTLSTSSLTFHAQIIACKRSSFLALEALEDEINKEKMIEIWSTHGSSGLLCGRKRRSCPW